MSEDEEAMPFHSHFPEVVDLWPLSLDFFGADAGANFSAQNEKGEESQMETLPLFDMSSC